jgi:cell division septation protein DedD
MKRAGNQHSAASKFQAWLAGAGEYRLALAISGISMALIVLAVLSPLWMSSKEQTEERTFAARPSFSPPIRNRVESGPAVSTAPRAAQDMIPAPQPAKKKTKKPAPPPQQALARGGKKSGAVTAVKPGPGYYIQVGAFRSAKRAKAMMTKLKSAGWSSRIVERTGGLQGVWVGPWQSKSAAAKAMRRLAKEQKLKGFIVRPAS